MGEGGENYVFIVAPAPRDQQLMRMAFFYFRSARVQRSAAAI